MIVNSLIGSKIKPRSLLSMISYSLFIQTKTTPNPNFLKFVPAGKTVMKTGTMDIAAPRFASCSPLARKLFNIDGITRVFYGYDHISVSKKEQADWNLLKPMVYALIQQQFQSEEPLIIDYQEPDDTAIDPNDSEVVQLIKEILSTRVRPTVQQDGGDIKFQKFDETQGKVYLMMMGSCSGCPSSAQTLKGGIQKMLRHYVAEVKSVVARDFDGQTGSDKKQTQNQTQIQTQTCNDPNHNHSHGGHKHNHSHNHSHNKNK